MEIGSVFIWVSYPFNHEKDPKDRWFVYLGEYRESNDPFDKTSSIFVVIPTTTSRIEYYEPGGYRENHLFVMFTPEEGFGFSKKCILDLTHFEPVVEKHVFDKFLERGTILKQGEISTSRIREIYEKICISSGYSMILKKKIRHNLTTAGISGLPVPKRKNRKRKH